MRFGLHLPQFGPALTAGAIELAANKAEELGFDDVWVSDHLVAAAGQSSPSPCMYDPLVALAFAAAVTTRIGLGTSVLVAPQYPSPLAIANSLASLDFMSQGRLTVGTGIGWSRTEYEALGASFEHRAERLMEIVDLWRQAWSDDPLTYEGRFYSCHDISLFPKPAHDIPIWLGGNSESAITRAIRVASGYHAIGITPERSAAFVDEIRAVRPAESFTISVRIALDVRTDPNALIGDVAAYNASGVQHLLFDPHMPTRLQGLRDGGGVDEWLATVEWLAQQLGLT